MMPFYNLTSSLNREREREMILLESVDKLLSKLLLLQFFPHSGSFFPGQSSVRELTKSSHPPGVCAASHRPRSL